MGAKRVVVTGASSGIGRATAELFARRGWAVTGVARRADRLAELAESIGADVVAADLTTADGVEALRAHLDALGGRVDVLVNNAGGARGMEPLEQADPDEWRWMFEANVLSTQRVTTALLPLLRATAAEAGNADIVVVTSIAATEPYLGGAGYNAAKAAEAALTRVLRLELAGEPLRVIEVAPGMVKTEEFSLRRFHGDAERAEKVYAGVVDPLRAEDIAQVIVQAIELPGHVNLDHITVRPVAQAARDRVMRGRLEVAGGD